MVVPSQCSGSRLGSSGISSSVAINSLRPEESSPRFPASPGLRAARVANMQARQSSSAMHCCSVLDCRQPHRQRCTRTLFHSRPAAKVKLYVQYASDAWCAGSFRSNIQKVDLLAGPCLTEHTKQSRRPRARQKHQRLQTACPRKQSMATDWTVLAYHCCALRTCNTSADTVPQFLDTVQFQCCLIMLVSSYS